MRCRAQQPDTYNGSPKMTAGDRPRIARGSTTTRTCFTPSRTVCLHATCAYRTCCCLCRRQCHLGSVLAEAVVSWIPFSVSVCAAAALVDDPSLSITHTACSRMALYSSREVLFRKLSGQTRDYYIESSCTFATFTALLAEYSIF